MRTQWCITSLFVASLVSLMAGSATAQLNLSNPNSFLQGTYRYDECRDLFPVRGVHAPA